MAGQARAYLQEVILKYLCNLVFHKALAYPQDVKLKYLCNLVFHKALAYPQEVKLKYLCNLAYHKVTAGVSGKIVQRLLLRQQQQVRRMGPG